MCFNADFFAGGALPECVDIAERERCRFGRSSFGRWGGRAESALGNIRAYRSAGVGCAAGGCGFAERAGVVGVSVAGGDGAC